MNRQRGVVLIVSLVFLLLLTLLATSSLQNATLQEKMAGSVALRDVSFQAAEAVLRTAETHVLTPGFALSKCTTPRACVPPPEALTLSAAGEGRASGVIWRVAPGGFFGIQHLGETEDLIGMPSPARPQKLYRVTAVALHGASRTVLESVHTQERRVLWRQRQ